MYLIVDILIVILFMTSFASTIATQPNNTIFYFDHYYIDVIIIHNTYMIINNWSGV